MRKKIYRGQPKSDAVNTMKKIGPRQQMTLDLLRDYLYLPGPTIWGLHPEPGNKEGFLDDLQNMMRPPHLALIIPDGIRTPGRLWTTYHPYGLPPKPRQRVPRFDFHSSMIFTARASMHNGCNKHGFRFITWRSANKEHVHQSQQNLKLPRIPLKEKTYNPDDCYIIEYPNGQYRRFFVEIDRGNESNYSTTAHKTTSRMFNQMREVTRDRLYYEYLGFKNILFLVICKNDADMKSLMDTCRQELGKASNILFNTFPEWEPHPNARLLETPYKRVGYPDFSLMEMPDVQKTA